MLTNATDDLCCIEARPRDAGALGAGEIRVEVVEDPRLADGFSWNRSCRTVALSEARVSAQQHFPVLQHMPTEQSFEFEQGSPI
jgi:hypothetical protein